MVEIAEFITARFNGLTNPGKDVERPASHLSARYHAVNGVAMQSRGFVELLDLRYQNIRQSRVKIDHKIILKEIIMQKWEYNTEFKEWLTANDLSELGENGWELVTILSVELNTFSNGKGYAYIFKRSKTAT